MRGIGPCDLLYHFEIFFTSVCLAEPEEHATRKSTSCSLAVQLRILLSLLLLFFSLLRLYKTRTRIKEGALSGSAPGIKR